MFVRERFELAESTLEEIRGMVPKFGYNGFGEFIYYRTYSREICARCRSGIKFSSTRGEYCRKCGDTFDKAQENWGDTVIRTMQGALSIRKDWYVRNHIAWDEDFWQHYGRNMAISMFRMQWMPPGRGLWAMGTDFIYERGSMALQNCGMSTIGDDIGADVNWLMDALMCGVGTGFIPIRNDDMIVYSPIGEYDFVIADSREGWCDSVETLISSYLSPGLPKPRMIYDLVRGAGQPIRGFGGISSGPDSLRDLHAKIEQFMDMYGTLPWYDSFLLKTDIANCVGCCVVAGNVRRSAQLLAGEMDDIIDLKNYDKYPYREGHGYMSNNSALLKMDSDFERLGEIAERVKRNGEPGYINLRNLPLGRVGKPMGELRLDRAIAFNPCLVYDSQVLTADGRGYVKIGELAEIGEDLDVYAIDDRDDLCIKRMRHPRKTGEQVSVVRVTFDDGSSIRCTPNHKVVLRDRSCVEAASLSYGDSVALVNRYNSFERRVGTYWADYIQMGHSGQIKFEHRMVAEQKFGPIGQDQHVHHVNEDKKDNRPDNLELRSRVDHLSEHSAGESNSNYSGVSNADILAMGVSMASQLGRRFSSKEWRGVGIWIDSQYRRQEFGNFAQFAILCADLAEVRNDPVDPRTLKLLAVAAEQGYDCEIVGDVVHVLRACENCREKFWIDYQRREQSYCSHYCHNLKRDYSANAAGQRRHFDARRTVVADAQLRIYVELHKKLGRLPMRKEWEAACRAEQVSSAVGRSGSAHTSWGDVVVGARSYNHFVVSVVYDGVADVYNGTVDDCHNYVVKICDDRSKGFDIERGIVTPQCGEQPLEDKELCTLSETCPTLCDGAEEWYRAAEYAAVYAATVTLLPTHRPETNAVMLRNRRIGVGIIDVVGWAKEIGTTRLIKYLRAGYDRVRSTTRWTNSEAGIPLPLRVTTIKPGGTTPKLPGLRSGWQWPTFGATLRRVRVARNQPVYKILHAAGVPHEPDVFSAGTDCFEWPIDQCDGGLIRPATEVSLWEQAMMLVLLQREWSDNAVSNTLYFRPRWNLVHDVNVGEFHQLQGEILISVESIIPIPYEDLLVAQEYEDDRVRVTLVQDQWTGDWRVRVYEYDPDHEEDDIEGVLAAIAPLTKSVAVLPHSAKGAYRQMPEEGISQTEYERRLAAIAAIDWSLLRGSDGMDEKYCDGPACSFSPTA